MRLLLDTHALVWWIGGDERFPEPVRSVVRDPATQVVVSVVSVWELVIKESLGRIRLPGGGPEAIRDVITNDGFDVLPVELRHAFRAASLPTIHADPFDRMLVAQAAEEGLTLVTGDRVLQSYAVDHLWQEQVALATVISW